MESLHLIVRIAGRRVALPAGDIGAVVEVDAITPVPLAPAHVAGLFALRSRVMTVIDSQAALGFGAMPRGAVATAATLSVESHPYALLIEEVEDVVMLEAPVRCAAVLGAGWSRVAVGQLRHGDETLLLLNPAALIAGPLALAA